MLIPWLEKKTNAYVRNVIAEKQTLMSEINRCKLMFFGHSRCKEGNNFETVMEGMVEDHQSRG